MILDDVCAASPGRIALFPTGDCPTGSGPTTGER